jgi:hypothetical protein
MSIRLVLSVSISILFSTAARADAPALRCEPATLRPGDTLTVTLPDPHGRELAVQTPNGFFYLAWDEHAGIDATPKLGGFAAAHVLALDSRSLEGWRFAHANPGWERVFAGSGEYVFRSGDVLQSDSTPDGSIEPSSCRVRYEE